MNTNYTMPAGRFFMEYSIFWGLSLCGCGGGWVGGGGVNDLF